MTDGTDFVAFNKIKKALADSTMLVHLKPDALLC